MRSLIAVFDFYLEASIHVALAVTALYSTTLLDLGLSLNSYFALFLFTGTVLCYNFMKYGVEAYKYVVVKKPYQQLIQGISFLCFPLAMYCFLQLPYRLWFPIALLTVLSGLYILPFLPQSRNLRSFGGFKIYLVALVWTGFTVVLPVVEHAMEITLGLVLPMLRRFILVVLLLLPFEIKDMKVDSPEMRTLPQRIGVKKTKQLGYFVIIGYLVLTAWDLCDQKGWYIRLLLYFFVLLLLISRSGAGRSKYHSTFWVEGAPILFLLVQLAVERPSCF